MKKSLIPVILTVSAALSVLSCGSTSGRADWLVVAGEDTLFVDDARVAWEEMDLESRRMFLEGADPGYSLVRAMARKALIETEIHDQEILSEPDIVAYKRLWVGTESGIVSRGIRISLESESLTADEIDFFTGYYGYKVWYTENPGTPEAVSTGPVQLVLHEQFDVARALAEVDPGGIVPGPDRIRYRLDILEAPDSLTAAEIAANRGALADEAAVFISQQRARDWYLALQDSLPAVYGIAVDASLVINLAGYYSGTDVIDFSAVIINSELGNWTVLDLMRAISFVDTRIPGSPQQESWIYFVIENVLMHDYFRSTLAAEEPALFDSLQTEGDHYVMGLAVDTLYKREVESRIQVTNADIEQEFNSQETPITTEELRVFETAVVSPEQLASLAALQSPDEINSFLHLLPGYSVLELPDSDSGLTRPVTSGAVPSGYGEELFSQDPDDTLSWTGPSDIPGSQEKIYWRLVEVIPSRFAAMGEILPQLGESAYQRLVYERVEEWISDLEEEHGLSINSALIETLPADPGIWVSGAV